MLMSLPLLSAEQFDEGYNYITSLAEEWGLYDDFDDVFDYFEHWLEEVF